jgi:hypothetical protein
MYSGLEDALRDPTQNVTISTKPIVPPTGDSTTSSSTTPSLTGGAGATSNTPKLKRNPTLVSTPSTVQADDIYAAKLAQAQFKTSTDYLAALRDLGFTNDKGQYIPGLLQTEAMRREYDLRDQERLATDQVNEGAVKGGAFFSGRRAENLANTQDPYNTKIARNFNDLQTDRIDRYSDITNLLSGYSLTMDELLAELAGRQSQRAQDHPSGPLTATPHPGVTRSPVAGHYSPTNPLGR